MLYSLLKAGLLFLNALAVLHPTRFLEPLGFIETHPTDPTKPQEASMKSRIASTLSWSRGLRCAWVKSCSEALAPTLGKVGESGLYGLFSPQCPWEARQHTYPGSSLLSNTPVLLISCGLSAFLSSSFFRAPFIFLRTRH